VASPKRGRAVLASLDLSDEERGRIKSPAGLDIGARTPEEVALSILAEVIERRSERGPRPGLRSLPLLGEPPAPTGATAIDPICKMKVAAVESSIHAEVGGMTFYFCCPGCKDTFLADPAAYLGS
jgi:xanthine dehydrogenase accessory factor